jgi:hypothetical protein
MYGQCSPTPWNPPKKNKFFLYFTGSFSEHSVHVNCSTSKHLNLERSHFYILFTFIIGLRVIECALGMPRASNAQNSDPLSETLENTVWGSVHKPLDHIGSLPWSPPNSLTWSAYISNITLLKLDLPKKWVCICVNGSFLWCINEWLRLIESINPNRLLFGTSSWKSIMAGHNPSSSLHGNNVTCSHKRRQLSVRHLGLRGAK